MKKMVSRVIQMDTQLRHPTDLNGTYVTLFFSSAEDEEDTIAAQEVIEGDGDHVEELDDLAREGK